MVSDPVLQWVLTLAFTATSVYVAIRLFLDRKPLLIIGNILHFLMSVVMVAMCWPWWSLIPAVPQIVVFAIGAVWFLLLAILQTRSALPRAAGAGHGAWHQLAHAIMMLAMVWMVVAMPGDASGGDHAHHHGGLPLWASLSGVAVTALLLVSGVLLLVETALCLRGKTTWLGHTGDVASGTVMSLGMAAMCWPMIAG